MNQRAQRGPVDVGFGRQVRRPGAGRARELGLDTRTRRSGLRRARGARRTRRAPCPSWWGSPADRGCGRASPRRDASGRSRAGSRSRHAASAATLPSPRAGRSAHTRAELMSSLVHAKRELGDRVEPEGGKAIAHEVLHGLHVVARDRFLLGEPVDLGLAEVAIQRAQALGIRQRRRAEQRAFGERDEPTPPRPRTRPGSGPPRKDSRPARRPRRNTARRAG